MNKFISLLVLIPIVFFLSSTASAKTNNTKGQLEIYQLSYVEREPGTDEYEVVFLVSQRYIRINESGENSGYILYDDEEKVIYSVGHHDHSILVINQYAFSENDSPVKAKIEYLQLADAPEVSGKKIYNYRVFIDDASDDKKIATKGNVKESTDEVTCMELQLVEGILPEVRAILKRYQKIVSGQQVKMTDNKITEMQPACYFVDQIFNAGKYYDKGLPIQEWHSNERFKALTSYKKIKVSSDVFSTPADYKKFSIDLNSKTFIK